MPQVTSVVVEFGRRDLKRDYIMGPTLDTILANTDKGIRFGGTEYTSYRPLRKKEISKLKLMNYEIGCEAVAQHGQTFFLESR